MLRNHTPCQCQIFSELQAVSMHNGPHQQAGDVEGTVLVQHQQHLCKPCDRSRQDGCSIIALCGCWLSSSSGGTFFGSGFSRIPKSLMICPWFHELLWHAASGMPDSCLGIRRVEAAPAAAGALAVGLKRPAEAAGLDMQEGARANPAQPGTPPPPPPPPPPPTHTRTVLLCSNHGTHIQ